MVKSKKKKCSECGKKFVDLKGHKKRIHPTKKKKKVRKKKVHGNKIAQKGNKNAVGEHKSKPGRKSAMQERADAEFLWELFTKPMSRDAIRKRLARGKYSLKDVMVSKAFSGNERILIELFKKIFPSNVNIAGQLQTKNLEVIEHNVKLILESAKKSASDGKET